MAAFVLDAPTAIAGFASDEEEPAAAAVVSRGFADIVAVPALWPFEVANILALKVRRGTLPPADRLLALRTTRDLRLSIDPVDVRSEHFESVIALAEVHRLTIYDAAYLELAMRLGAPLATLDKALARAAAAEKIDLLVDGIRPAWRAARIVLNYMKYQVV